MFIDKQTGIEIHAELNETVIRATHRPQDLVPAFLRVIQNTPEHYTLVMSIPDSALDDDNDPWWDSEDCSCFLNEELLWNVLNRYAPDGYYFGCTEGDGSDYGYWEYEEEEEADEIESNTKEVRYDIISPDGFSFLQSIDQLPDTVSGAVRKMADILERYERQGYYSDKYRNKLSPLETLRACNIRPFVVAD